MKLIRMGSLCFICLCALSFSPVPLSAAYYVKPGGGLIDAKLKATLSVQEHYSLATEELKNENWEPAAAQFNIILANFPDSPFAQDSRYYLGVCYYRCDELDLADKQFSKYLKTQGRLKYFEDTFHYKFNIAEKFRTGAKRHLFGSAKMPKLMPAKDEALALYNEIITTLPSHELAVKALNSKGMLLEAMGDSSGSIEAYQLLISRFPKHELAAASYLAIAKLYLEQSHTPSHDPDLLALAQINLRKFRDDFPGDERVKTAEECFANVREAQARNLYETGRFFERTKKPSASVLYYATATREYPDTASAGLCKKRLEALKDVAEKAGFPQESS